LNVIISSFFSLNKFLHFYSSQSNLSLSMNRFEGFDVDLLGLEILVVFEFIEGLGEVFVRWSVVFVHWHESWSSFFVRVLLPMEVSVSDHTVSWLPVVVTVGFVVVEMGEWGGVGVAHEKWEVRVSIIDSIRILSIHESQNVVFDDWALGHSGGARSSDISSNGITEGENILESLVLKGIWVDIDQTIGVSDTTVDEVLPWLTWRVEVSVIESWFNNLSAVNILESGNLLTYFTVMNFQKFPSEHDFDSSLVAFFKSNFVSITKLEDFFVWSPVLDFRSKSMSS
jgi:hypothetical protein